MTRILLRCGFLVLTMACVSLALSERTWAEGFDKPLSKKTIALSSANTSPQNRAKVTCYWFPKFMVKEVDMGEKGASRLAIVPFLKKGPHDCSRLRERTEKAINPDDWSGYFKGVKGDLVFFDADDGWNGGVGFAVFDAKTGKKIFDDVAVGDLDFTQPTAIVGTKDMATTLRYTRAVDGGCVVPKEGGACWEKIKQRFALTRESVTPGSATQESAPDCKAGYEKSAQALAKGRCEAQNTPTAACLEKEIPLARQQTNDGTSIIVYPVQLVLGEGATVRPVSGEMKCWASD